MQKVQQLQDRYDQSAKSDKPLIEPPAPLKEYDQKGKKKNQKPGNKMENEK